MRTQSVMALLVVAFTAAPALADIPPPSTYVETCTIAKQQTTGSECLQCSAYFGDVDRCSKLLNPYCYAKVCKAWGASSWSEVLCRSAGANAPVVPTDIIAILSSATTPAPSTSAVDAGIPKTCLLVPPVTDTKTATATQSATETKSATDSKTDSQTDSKSATQTATSTQSATDVKTATATQSPSNTQTATSTQSASTTQASTDTQSTTSSQTATTVSATSTQTTTGPASKPSQDSSGCSVTTGKVAFRALGPLTVILAGLALVALRRRSRR
jgi:hypothetical protein